MSTSPASMPAFSQTPSYSRTISRRATTTTNSLPPALRAPGV